MWIYSLVFNGMRSSTYPPVEPINIDDIVRDIIDITDWAFDISIGIYDLSIMDLGHGSFMMFIDKNIITSKHILWCSIKSRSKLQVAKIFGSKLGNLWTRVDVNHSNYNIDDVADLCRILRSARAGSSSQHSNPKHNSIFAKIDKWSDDIVYKFLSG